MLPYIVTIFLSAFLLFQVQPLLAKAILPWFGGSASVWTVCLMFFQVLLLLGYLYAHATTRHLAPKAQSLLHIGLLALSLLFLPILPDAGWKPQGTEDPTLRIVLLLLVTVGLPYFLLSTTGSLLQAWFVRQRSDEQRSDEQRSDEQRSDEQRSDEQRSDEQRSDEQRSDEQSTGGGVEGGVKSVSPSLPSSASVYRLYAVSNAGSLLALLSYPVGVEPYLPTSLQAWVWSGGYLLFALMCGGIAWSARNAAPLQSEASAVEASVVQGETSTEAAKSGWKLHLLWALFVFTSTTLLLAVTSHLTQNIAPVPFLWIAPLSLYLLSFILCFGSATWTWKPFWLVWPPLALGAMSFGLTRAGEAILDVGYQMLVFLLGLFICCVVCHGELARSKPRPAYLTSYYLMISLGGALAGIFVGMIAPQIFVTYQEMPLGLILCTAIALFSLYLPLYRELRKPLLLAPAGLTALILLYILQLTLFTQGEARYMARNFYGTLLVYGYTDPDTDIHVRTFVHGTIEHGNQFLEPEDRRRFPTTYFGPYSGIRLALAAIENQPQARVGIVGLGVGTLAAYAKPGHTYRFYEINPQVVHVAQNEFYYLKDCEGKVEIAVGDARLLLEREKSQQYDVLVMDAFSSDAVPVHLLTKEAFELYFRHLKPDGILAVNVSNDYLELEALVERMATLFGKQSRIINSRERPEIAVNAASWVLVTSRPGFFTTGLLKEAGQPIPPRPDLRVWTDNYSNLIQILE